MLMKRGTDLKLIIIFVLIIIACCLVILFSRSRFNNGTFAQIKLGDEVIKTVDLSDVKEPYEFQIKTDRGYNTVRVENGRIAVTEADCPDKVCVRRGYAQSGSLPIVCLPHRLTICITGESDFDAVSGER